MNAVDTQRMKSAQMVAHARMNGLQAQIARLESAVDGSTLADEAQCDEEVRQIGEIIKGYNFPHYSGAHLSSVVSLQRRVSRVLNAQGRSSGTVPRCATRSCVQAISTTCNAHFPLLHRRCLWSDMTHWHGPRWGG
jgi:hypothetical protein